MKEYNLLRQPVLKSKIIIHLFWAGLSGLLLTLSFPGWNQAWIAWFALVPLLKATENHSPKQAFQLGIVCGLIHYLTLIYWVYNVLAQYGGLDPATTTALLLVLCFYLSLYIGFFALCFTRFKDRKFAGLYLAILWVGLEFLRAKLLTGFPWCLLGYSQYQHLTLIQIANLTGVYGLSFLIILVNLLILNLLKKGSFLSKGTLKWETALCAFLFCASWIYGNYTLARIEKATPPNKPLKAAIIQGNIDQSLKWDPAYQERTIRIYQDLTRSIYASKPELIIWPETSVPLFFQDQNELTESVSKVPQEAGADLIFGSPAYQIRENRADQYLNRAYHLGQNGKVSDYYDKVHLVPFGEYVPLKKLLFFVERLVTAAGDFIPGAEIKTIQLPQQKAGILICFESIFPEIACQQVRQGADLLIILTNDAWYGRTSAPFQHFDMAVFRAVENQRPVLRAANTGISGFIGPQGRILQQSALFTPAALFREIPTLHTDLTFYSRFGDLFAVLFSLISFLMILSDLWYNKRKMKAER